MSFHRSFKILEIRKISLRLSVTSFSRANLRSSERWPVMVKTSFKIPSNTIEFSNKKKSELRIYTAPWPNLQRIKLNKSRSPKVTHHTIPLIEHS